MKYEIQRTYTNRENGVFLLDKEASTPAREITDEQAKNFMMFLEQMGFKRHENNSQIFYDLRSDSRHVEEHIFYK